MVNAKLHIICGNCGCNDNFEYNTRDALIDDEGKLSSSVEVSIICLNCSTIHGLEDNATEINKEVMR